MQQTRFERRETQHIRVHVFPTDRFKTYAVSLYIGYPLDESTVTSTAMIPFVLRRGTRMYPETKAFRERLDEMYGAGFGFDIYKRGNNQIVQFRMDTVDDRFTQTQTTTLLEETLTFLGQTLTRPALENNRFVDKYMDSEKHTLRKRLQSIVNDKIRYAAERCTQEMFPNDPFRYNPLGRLEDIEAIDSAMLYDHYCSWLERAPIDLYVVGNTTLQEVSSIVDEYFLIRGGQSFNYRIQATDKSTDEPKIVIEELDVNQGKLNMGLVAPFTYENPDYPAAMLYNGILGGYPHSKLFTNVREKASLAYYASSRLDGYKGMLMIQSGIEAANYDKAAGIIKEQLELMQSGVISDLEISQTKAMMSNQLREVNDSALEMIAFDFNTVLTGFERTILSVLEDINKVKKEQIQAIAEQVRIDTIYFLRGRKGE